MSRNSRPLVDRLLEAALPAGPSAEAIRGDLDQEFQARRRAGRVAASIWYTSQALSVIMWAAFDRLRGRAWSSPGYRSPRRSFGGVDQMKERHRDVRGFRWIGDFGQDIRLALRTLHRDRGFAAVVILTLAVAIGANTAIFSVVYGVLLRPLPLRDADRIVTVAAGRLPGPGGAARVLPFSALGYWHFMNNNRAFETFGGYTTGVLQMPLTGTGDGPPLQITMGLMTASAFQVLGTPPQRGRLPTAEDGMVTVLSHGLWVDRYGSDPSIIGRSILLSGGPFDVIGVMPEGYDFPTSEIDLWTLTVFPESENSSRHAISAVARLAPGVTIEEAVADATRLIGDFDELGYAPSWLSAFSGVGVVRTLQDGVVRGARRPLLILLGTVSFVLLIACSNVANLFLVRAETRTRESAVRMALGSGRGRLARYVLTESVLLALIGGTAGVLLAYVGIRALVSVGPATIPRLDSIGIRGSALLYTSGLSVFTGLLFGVLPALRAGSDKMLGVLRDGGRGSTIGRDRHRARSVLVVAQVALALVLVVGSGLMVRSFQELRAVDPGFRAEGLLTFTVAPALMKYGSPESRAQFFDGLIDRLEEIPQVISAGGVTRLPLSGSAGQIARIEEFPPTADELGTSVQIRRATPGYFETMEIPVLEGRSFTQDDHNERLGSLIISKSIKDQYWPDETALGKRIRALGAPARSVGVVGDVRARGLDLPAELYLYNPMLDSVGGSVSAMAIVVRSDADPLSLVPAVRSAIEAIDPDVPISDVRSMEDVVADSMSRTTFIMSLLLLAAVIALFLGSVGIYGVSSYMVSQRTPEIGVRLALGAEPKKVRRMILMQGMKLAGAGIVIGLLVAAAMGRLLDSLLYGVGSLDALTFVGGSLIFLAVAALSVVIPALRASRIPPAVALQSM